MQPFTSHVLNFLIVLWFHKIHCLTLFIHKVFGYLYGFITAFGLRATVFQSRLGNTPWCHPALLPENKSASCLPFLFHTRPPTLCTDPTRQAKLPAH